MRRADTGAVLALLLVPALLAGCSSSPSGADRTPGPGASTSGSSSSGSTGASGSTGSRVSPAEVGRCMRDHGYDVDDSEFATGGEAGARFSAPEGVDAEQYSADLVECSGGSGDAPAAKPLPGSDERNRKAAACIRAGGFPDYPDGIEEERKWTPPDEDTFDRVAKKCDAEAFGTGERFETGAEAGR
jgi:hypothetical protein